MKLRRFARIVNAFYCTAPIFFRVRRPHLPGRFGVAAYCRRRLQEAACRTRYANGDMRDARKFAFPFCHDALENYRAEMYGCDKGRAFQGHGACRFRHDDLENNSPSNGNAPATNIPKHSRNILHRSGYPSRVERDVMKFLSAKNCAARLKQSAAVMAIIAALPQAALAGNIATAGDTYKASQLGVSVSPVFQGGTLLIDSGGQTYSQNFTLDTSTTNTIDQTGNSATFSGIFSDAVTSTASPGNLIIANSGSGGAITFTGINTYTGTTTINAGATLVLSGAGAIATSSSVADGGTFDISQTSNGASILSLAGSGSVVLGARALTITGAVGSFTGVISGTGGLVVTSGTESLGGENTYTGGTIINGGTLAIGAGGASGSILGNVADSGTLSFYRTDAINFDGLISGSGGVTQLGSGTTTLTQAETYSGVTAVSAGTLALGANASISSSSGVNTTGTFDISATPGTSIKSLAGTGTVNLGSETLTLTGANGTFSGVIQGSGGLVVAGGTQTLTGLNTYTGTTTITGGTLQLGSALITNNIADGGAVSFFSNTAVTMTGVISGSGTVSQSGTGVTTLTANQTYTGQTVITLGTLALSGSGNLTASSGVVDNGILDISAAAGGATLKTLSGGGTVQLGAQTLSLSSASDTFTGALAGTGGFTLAGGTETLSGISTLTGTVTVASGTLSLGNSNTLATAARVVDNASLDISGASNAATSATAALQSLAGSGTVTLGTRTLVLTNAADTFSGTISGTGGLTVSGGTQTLSGANSYTGATTITAGVLAIANGGSVAATTALTDNGTFDISATGTPIGLASLAGTGAVTLGASELTLNNAADTFSGIISGSGGLTLAGGNEVLAGANNYTGGTVISAGTLQIGRGIASGSILGDVVDNGTLAFDRSDSIVFTGAVSGSGTLSQIGVGTTALTAANSYGGGTLISAGTLQVGNGGTTGAITGNVTDNATLAFDRSDAVSFGGTISGSGGVSQIGTGSLTLTAINSYAGKTVIPGGGSLILASGASIAASSGVADDGMLNLSATTAPRLASLSGAGAVQLGTQSLTLTNGADSFAGILSGSGGLTMSGGTQTLAGVNGYTGATAVTGGMLVVNGSIASSSGVAVASGGTLAGNGTTSAVTIASGGTLAPGSAGSGTLKINGGLNFASGSTLLVNLSSASAPSVAATGAANIAGTLQVASTDGTLLLGQKVTVLSAAGGVNGTFALAQIQSTGAQFQSAVSYDANDVYLQVNLAKLSPLLSTSATRNQASAVGGIDAAIAAGDTLPTAIQNLGTVTSAVLGTDAAQLGGEIGADIPQAGGALMHPFMDALFDHMTDGSGRHGVWASGFASTALVGGDAAIGSQKLNNRVAGLALGTDWRVSPGFSFGAALSFASNDFHIANAMGTGKADGYQGGVYGLMRFSPHTYGSFAGIVALDDVTTHRTLNVAGTDQLDGKVKPLMLGGRYETGVKLGWLTPYLAVEDMFTHSAAYGETASSGASSFALRYGANNANSASVELGARQGADVPLDRIWTLSLSDRLAWSHAVSTAWNTGVSFASLPDSGFTVYGARPARDSALISLGAELKSRSGLGLDAHFESSVSRNAQSYTGIAGFNYTW
jgi:autotransporter-associated beta strand protein